jgi:hypothetical protein
MNHFNIRSFGAQPNSPALATEAIKKAIHACVEQGGGRVYVPPGTYRCSPFQLYSNMTLYLEAGAILLGSEKLEDYPIEDNKLSQESRRAGLVTAHHAENVSIAGRGAIDGNALPFLLQDRVASFQPHERKYTRQGEAYMPDEQIIHGPLRYIERPGNLVRFHNCRNVDFQGVTIRNSPTWTVHFKDCEDVSIHGVRINSPGTANRTPNDDGVDLENCVRVRISDCEIDTGDDCIAVFGSQQVAVTNCTLRSRSAGVRVNYDIGHARDLVFNNLVIDANRGITMMCRGEAVTENVLFSNLVIRARMVTGDWWGMGEPISITAVAGSSNPFPPGEAPFNMNRSSFTGKIQNVRFNNILAESDHGIVVYGGERGRIQDLHFENVRLTIRSSPYHAVKGGNFDLRPSAVQEQNLFAHDIPAFFARFVDGLTIRAMEVGWEDGLPEYFTHALHVEHFNRLRIEGFRGRQAHADCEHAPILLENGRDAVIVNAAGSDKLESKNVEGQQLL